MSHTSPTAWRNPRALAFTLLSVLLIRMLHLASAMRSPLTYQFGPDEEFHVRMAQAIAAGAGGEPLFGFMDPLYGYLLAGVFALTGFNIFAIYLLQVLVDVATALGLVLIGRELGRERAGLAAAVLYALSLTATLYATTLLKATWVAALLVYWTLLALSTVRTPERWRWLALGVLGGVAVALRSNLLLLSLAAAVLLPVLAGREHGLRWRAGRGALLLAGLLLALLPLSLRNATVSGSYSPLPANGGIVLHQLYNPANPRAEQFAPAFVAQRHPIHIWQGYSVEAETRLGRKLLGHEVDRYWRGEALAHLAAHPGQAAANMLRKFLQFFANAEVPNNRSLADERVFSPVLRWLPPSTGLFAILALPGLLFLLRRDRRGWIVLLPVAVVGFTFVVFFAEARYRFHALPLLCLGCAWLLAEVWRWLRVRQWPLAGLALTASAVLAAVSLWQARGIDAPGPNWHRIALGQIKSGEPERARESLGRLREQGESAGLHELEAWFALGEGRLDDAAAHYRAGIALRPSVDALHHNLALVLARQGDTREALAVAQHAASLAPSGDNLLLLAQLLEREGRSSDAADVYRSMLDGSHPVAPTHREQARAALERLGHGTPKPQAETPPEAD